MPGITGKLGKNAPKASRRILAFGAYAESLPSPPTYISWHAGRVKQWPVYLNDRIGDCTIAAAGHHLQCWKLWSAHQDLVLPDSYIQDAYVAVTGLEGAAFDPKTGKNDNGCAMTDVLHYWTSTGIGGHKISGATSVSPTNIDHAKWATVFFGGLYTGLALPESAQSQTVWAVPSGGAKGPGAPGSWGGHCVPILGYNKDYLYCVTWGQVVGMTWGFFTTYCDEAYAICSGDWLNAAGFSPLGMNMQALQADLAAVQG